MFSGVCDSGVIFLSNCSSCTNFCFKSWMSYWYFSIWDRAFSKSAIWRDTSNWNWSKLSITVRYSSLISFSHDNSFLKCTWEGKEEGIYKFRTCFAVFKEKKKKESLQSVILESCVIFASSINISLLQNFMTTQ